MKSGKETVKFGVMRLGAGWRWLDAAGFVLGVGLITYLALIGISYSVNIPIQDEWNNFLPDRLDHHLNWTWLFEFHNEHRMVFTKVLTWLILRTAHYNSHVQVAVNAVLYGGLCIYLARFARQRLGAPVGLFLPVLACGMTYEIHMWSFQSHFHFYQIFFVVGLGCLLRRDRWQLATIPAGFCSAYSFSSGVICVAALATFAALLAWRHPDQRRRCAAIVIGLILIDCSWFLGYPATGIQATSPLAPSMWKFFGAQVARGFGYNETSMWWLGLVIVLSAAGMCLLQFKRWCSERDCDDAWLATTVYLLTGLTISVLVAHARTSLGMESAQGSRYLQNILLIVPAFWALTFSYLRKWSWCALAMGIALWLPFADEFHYTKNYSGLRNFFLVAQRCAWNYYAVGGEANCPHAHPYVPILGFLERARELNVTFATEAMATVGEQ